MTREFMAAFAVAGREGGGVSATVCDRCGVPFSRGFSGVAVIGNRYEHHPRCNPCTCRKGAKCAKCLGLVK